RGVPDARRRGPARRRALLPRRRLGVPGAGPGAGAPRRAAHVRARTSGDEVVQVTRLSFRTGAKRQAVEESPSNMNLTLHVWRQKSARAEGRMVEYRMKDVSPDMSFLEMLDVLNEELQTKGEEPIAFDSDCREGICGMCSLVINGVPHGPDRGTATCQLHMR